MNDTVLYKPAPVMVEERSMGKALANGLACRCPRCGKGKLFSSYLKVAPVCEACGLDLSGHEADDAPPYFTIFIVGHIVVPPMLWLELAYMPPMWIHLTLWPLLTLVLALGMLPPVKGAVIAWQWAYHMHGFDDTAAKTATESP